MSSPRDVLHSLSSSSSSSASHRARSPHSKLESRPTRPKDEPPSLESSGGLQELKSLVSLPFFDHIDQRTARKLSQRFVRRSFGRGEIVATLGDASSFHVLVRGKVDSVLTCVDGSIGDTIVASHSNPAYFGHHALVHGGLEPVTLRAAEEGTIVLSIGGKEFEAFTAENPSVRVALESKMDDRDGNSSQPTSISSPAPTNTTFSSPAPSSSSIPNSRPQSAVSSSSSSSSTSACSTSASSATSSASSPLDPDRMKLIVRLREIPFFQQLGQSIPEIKLQHLATLFEFRRCNGGEVLMREHDQPDGFYILTEGRINVSAMSKSNHQAMHLATLRAGDFAGEIALLQHTLRTATLTTIQPCTFLYLSCKNFETFLRLAPEVLANGLFTHIIHRRISNSLKTLPLFSCLSKKEIGPLKTFREEVLQQLGPMFVFEFVKQGVDIVKEGDVSDAFRLITRGVVEVRSRVVVDTEFVASSTSDEMRRKDSSSPSSSSSPGVRDLVLTELCQGDTIGEVSLLAGSRTTATVHTLTDCVFLKLSGKVFHEFLKIVPEEVRDTLERITSMRTAQTLSNIPFFRSLRENKPWSKLSILGSMFRFRHHSSGDIVVQEGEIGDTFFVLVEGTVEVTKLVHHSRRHGSGGGSEQIVLDILGRNSWFGELSLLPSIGGTIRLATVRCREDCLFLTVTKSAFDKFCQIAPDIVESFSAVVTYRTANMLRSIRFFQENIIENKPWSKLELLCTLFVYEYYEGGVTIMKEGEQDEKSNKLFVLSVGSVMATRQRRPADPPSDTFPLSALSPTPSPSPPATTTASPPVTQSVGHTDDTSAASSSSDPASSGPATARDITLQLPSLSVSVHPPPPLEITSPVGVVTSLPSSSSSSSEEPSTSPLYDKLLERGSFFNEVSLLHPTSVRPLTIRTLEPCVFFTLTYEKFHKFCQVCPELLHGLKRRYQEEEAEVEKDVEQQQATTTAESASASSSSRSRSNLGVPSSSTGSAGRPIRPSGSFSSGLTIPIVNPATGEIIGETEKKELGQSVLVDCMTIHHRDGSIVSSASSS